MKPTGNNPKQSTNFAHIVLGMYNMSMTYLKNVVTPVIMHWSYHSFAIRHQHIKLQYMIDCDSGQYTIHAYQHRQDTKSELTLLTTTTNDEETTDDSACSVSDNK